MRVKEKVFNYLTEKNAISVESSVTLHTISKDLKIPINRLHDLHFAKSKCFIRFEKFKRRLALYLTDITIKEDDKRICPRCNESFETPSSFGGHISGVHNNNEAYYEKMRITEKNGVKKAREIIVGVLIIVQIHTRTIFSTENNFKLWLFTPLD